ncbi:Putative ABC transporter substrate-binding protein YesO [Paenibacillus plantiphilus]|uniref:ABC transporter substrate-binding protein YesO n=1 Tax=Paenibacillus plantiphilus TaxID=2905650 RepID=A0ABM9C2M5_9BACL|nr:extracellular solute-binding protein [Paenibacillus plantiphilus]CAH1201758.1 Putative ABC transporter substrate-binding protein YesO [Paenibacillus plantiphilus]
MKKKSVGFVVILMIVAALSACSSNNNNSQGTSGQAGSSNGSSDKVVNLTFWGGVPAEAGPQEIVDTWNKQNPNIQVTYVRYVNDDSGNLKLDTALVSGQNVDIFANYTKPLLSKRVSSGAALDLSPFSEYNIDDKMGAGAKEWLVDDKYYALPTKRNMHFVWLNKDALDEAGLPVPTDWTLADVEKYAKALQTDTRWGYASFPFWRDVVSFDGSLAVQGSVKEDGTSNFDAPIVGEALQQQYDMMHTSKVSPPISLIETTKMNLIAEFLGNKVAMLNAGEWVFRDANNLTDYPRDFTAAFAPLPRMTEGQDDFRYLGGLGDAIAINAKSEHTKEAWEFLKWYADGGMLPQAAGGRIPASKDADQAKAIELLLGDLKDKYDLESLERVLSNELPTFQVSLPQEVLDIRTEEFDKYYIKAQSLEEAIQNVVKRHNEFLKRN